MEPRISMITLGVSDFERSRRFYVEGLGLELSPYSQPEVAFLALNGAWLALWSRDELAKDARVADTGPGFIPVSLAHNVESKEMVDAVLKQAEAAGARITHEAEDTFWGGYTGYFADPDGFLWEVAWNPTMPELAQL